MNIIIPMAGKGTRMRPHTLTVPKPLIPIAGRPIVQRLVEILKESTTEQIKEIAFIIGDFGKDVETELINIAQKVGAAGKIYYQHEALGTAHAIHCAKPSLNGEVIIAFADTLFKTDKIIDTQFDGTIWVKRVDNPEQFGVIIADENNKIVKFVEKPKNQISNLAIVGIYYFKDADYLSYEIEQLIQQNIAKNGEYQLTDVLQRLVDKGKTFIFQEIDEWFDCGNKDATLETNKRILELSANENLINQNITIENSQIINPCYIAENVLLKNSVIGPYVSIGENTIIENCVITNSIIQSNTLIKNVVIDNSMIGNHAEFTAKKMIVSVGDYNTINI